ncbi:MAG: hypothetical protein ABFD10_09300 [Prolixibacteraceae bacterium]
MGVKGYKVTGHGAWGIAETGNRRPEEGCRVKRLQGDRAWGIEQGA